MRKGWCHIFCTYIISYIPSTFTGKRSSQSHILPNSYSYCLQWIHLHRQTHRCWRQLLHRSLDSWTAGEMPFPIHQTQISDMGLFLFSNSSVFIFIFILQFVVSVLLWFIQKLLPSTLWAWASPSLMLHCFYTFLSMRCLCMLREINTKNKKNMLVIDFKFISPEIYFSFIISFLNVILLFTHLCFVKVPISLFPVNVVWIENHSR